MLSSMQEFFFLQKVSKMFSQCKSFTKEKVFLCSMQVARLLSQPWAICQGSRNRSQNRSWNFFLSCFWANEWPEKKKSFFFVKVRPRRVFHKNSGARTCLRTRPKCSQSKQTLKKRSPFVYHTQRKHGKLTIYWVIFPIMKISSPLLQKKSFRSSREATWVLQTFNLAQV